MREPLWVKMPVIKNKILFAAKDEEDIDFICKEGKITRENLNDPDFKLTLEQDIAIVKAALKISKDPFMGLHIGERTTQVVLGITGYLMECSKDVLTALQNLQQYTNLFTRLYSFRIETNERESIFFSEPIHSWNNISPETAQQTVDYSFTGTLHVLKLLTGKSLHPEKILYRYDEPDDISEYERIFKRKPLFNQNCNCMIFNPDDMKLPVIGYNKELNKYFNSLLEEELRREKQKSDFTQYVRQLILQNYNFEFPNLEEVARHIHITPRTLQRKLQEENTSFRILMDSIKQELACHLLSNKMLSITEIAYKLGYTEAGSFQRAFRQWTGKTPRDYRLSCH